MTSSTRTNELDQPIGAPVDWTGTRGPDRTPMVGRFCRLEALDVAAHGDDLFDAFGQDQQGGNWTYLGYGPFTARADFDRWIETTCLHDDPLFHAVVDVTSDRAVGVASFLRIDPAMGVIEVGHIHYSPLLQRQPAATEAMYLMMCRVFDELGYRRYEWKCDSLNAPSRRAALRLGFEYEGLFRQALVYKGRNRDTAWYSIIDNDWTALKSAYEAWLAPVNFDADGRQRRSLAACRADAGA